MNEGTIERRDGWVTFRYERHFAHSIDTVWKAITDPDEIRHWTGSRPEIDLRPGGHYVSHHGDGDRVVDRVERLDPPRLFEHTYFVHVNPSALVTWELSPTREGCRLNLTHSLDLEDVRAVGATAAMGDITVMLSRNGAGWHHLLDKLAAALDGQPSAPWSEQAHQDLRDRYAAVLR